MSLRINTSSLTDTKFYTHLLFLGATLLLLMPLSWILPDTFYTITYILITCLAFYIIITSLYAGFITTHMHLPTLAFFSGLFSLSNLLLQLIRKLINSPLPPLFFSIKAYYVARISSTLALILLSYFYVNKKKNLKKAYIGLMILFACLIVGSVFIFTEEFIIFTRQHSLGALYFNLFSHLLGPTALCFSFFQLYRIKEEILPIHQKIMLLFLFSSSIKECIDILYFTPLTTPVAISMLFNIFNLSLLAIAVIDICLLRPFEELNLKQVKSEQLLTTHSKSLNHYCEKVELLQEALHSQSTLYQKIISLFPEPFIVCIDSIIYQLNPAALNLLHSSNPHDFIGTNILSYIKDAPNLEERFSSLVGSEGSVLQGEASLLLPNNISYNIEYLFTANELYTKNTVICILKDVSSTYESQSAKKELYKQQLKLRYFSNISHDIKTPINIIYSALQMQSKSATLAECTHYTDMMHNSCLKLLKLLNNLLDLTKIDNQMFSVSPQTFNIVDAIESLCEVSSSYMATKNITYIFDTDVDEKYVYLDPNLIERIMLNLLSNAVKYTNPGGHISINIVNYSHTITIHVKDDGIGIPEDKLDSIFARYIMVGQNSSAHEHSCGMGLSIVKDLLHLMNGTIRCESKLGEGSEFIIALPTPHCSELSPELPYNTSYSTQNIKVEFCDI